MADSQQILPFSAQSQHRFVFTPIEDAEGISCLTLRSITVKAKSWGDNSGWLILPKITGTPAELVFSPGGVSCPIRWQLGGTWDLTPSVGTKYVYNAGGLAHIAQDHHHGHSTAHYIVSTWYTYRKSGWCGRNVLQAFCPTKWEILHLETACYLQVAFLYRLAQL